MESQREAKPPLHNELLFFFEENIKGEFKRGEAPLFNTLPLMIGIHIHIMEGIMESQREAKPPLYNHFPLPL